MLAGEARAYLHGGDSALGAYADRRPSVSREGEVRAILAESPYLVE